MNRFYAILSGVAFATLAACGGGSSSSGGTSTSLDLSGTAVQGAAIAGAAVEVKCTKGTANATTATDGAYSASVPEGVLPCVLRVSLGGGSYLHAAVGGTGNDAVRVNISPLTDVIVAQAAGVAPATLFGEFSTRSASITTTTLAAAVSYARSALAGSIDLTGINPLSDTLAVGDAQDQKIDALVAQLAADGTTLEALEALVISNPTPDPIKSVVASSAADCSRLKSGKYRMINPKESDPLFRAYVIAIDAVGLKGTSADGSFDIVSDGAGLCSFTVTETDSSGATTQSHKVLVSSSGILVDYSTVPQGGGNLYAIGLPEQALALSDLAGDYNLLDFGKTSDTATGDTVEYGTVSVDASGHVTASSNCGTGQTCPADAPPYDVFTVNPNGGFLISGNSAVRIFAYKNPGNGRKVLIAVHDGGGVTFGTNATALTLPEVGAVSKIWEFTANGNATMSTLTESNVTVTGVDSATGAVSRLRDRDQRTDTITYNDPRPGLRHRLANACSFPGGSSTCAAVIQMPLPGLTLSGSVGTNPASSFISFSVGRP